MDDSKCQFTIVPYDQSGVIKTPDLMNVNYTCQDFWSLKQRLRDLIKQRFADDFNDFVESSLAFMLIESWAFCADTLSFKIDQIANEIFIDSVSELDNAFRLAMLVGYHPQPPVASRSLWSATINALQPTDIVIDTPVAVNVSTEDGPRTIELFPADSNNNPMFDEPILITAGSFANNSVIGVEGITRQQGNTGDGMTNQSYRLAFGPVIWDSVRVSVDGLPWQRVEYFSDSIPRPEFRVEYDANYNGFLMFGNNRAGMVPSNGAQINITYRTGGGVAGNIVTGAVQLQRTYAVSGFEYRVPVSFRNYTRGEFGYDGDRIQDVKRKLPSYLRTQDRIVSASDYHAFVNQFATPYVGMVGKGKAIVRNHGCAGNIIDVYILSQDGVHGLVTTGNELKVALQEAIDEKKMLRDNVCIKDGEVLSVDVHMDVVMNRFYRKFEDEYRARVTAKLNAFFDLTRWEFDQDLKSVDIIKDISDIKEIKSISISLVTDDVTNSGDTVVSRYYQIIRPQTISLNFVYE